MLNIKKKPIDKYGQSCYNNIVPRGKKRKEVPTMKIKFFAALVVLLLSLSIPRATAAPVVTTYTMTSTPIQIANLMRR